MEKKNWDAYKERYNIERIDTTVNQECIEIMDSRGGLPTVRVISSNGKWIFLHSSVDPLKEAQKIAGTISTEPGKIIVVYGFALGYLVEALLEMVDERNLLFIIEPDRDLFFTAMGTRDLSHLINSENVCLVVGDTSKKIGDSFFSVYDVTKYKEIVMTGLLGHQTVYAAFYHKSIQCIKDVVNARLLNLATMIKMGPEFISNSILNLASYCTNPGISSLFNKFEGKPAIIVSAGPSLNKNIQLLKNAKGKAAILAVGTAVKALLRWGIEPDFIFSIDPQHLNYELHFNDVDMRGAALVSEIQSHHMIFENHHGPIFVSGDVPILKWFGDCIENKGKIETGGSVANNAFATAYKMGTNPIILVGQDLAYARDGHSHAAGTNYADRIYTGGENLNYFNIKANDGGEILTDRAFYQFLIFFELWIEKYPERTYINATEGGALIQGTKLMTLQEVLDQYCRQTIDVQTTIKEAQESFAVPKMEPILEILELRMKDINRTIDEANQAIKHLIQLKKACENRQGKKMQQHLKAVTNIYKKFEKDGHIREVIEWCAPKQMHTVLTRTYEAEYSANDDYSNAIADYSLYYKKIIDGSKRVKGPLQRCVEKTREWCQR